MGKEVRINIEVFNTNVEKLRNSVSGLETKLQTNRVFQKTNISPFVDDVENTARALEVLKKYRLFLEDDIVLLHDTGESMRDNDEQIATRINHVVSGPQPLKI
ncbi:MULTISPECIES: TIGR04197 family type VII secretion effector [Bacillaceae]|uniref:TIGR04197 family type VII secretion effector n=1 Tax=Evansella alkalicola TaxID=745819 RepID=A0ABS6JY16_9BACI|nr:MULTISPECIES: TIGR04197 family type VII secretion effector [Bacillaceae]MBU9723486.1 TIGR04197 family type VII secretion effector [Bacillus alkalicola]